MAGMESPGVGRYTSYEPPVCGRCAGMGYEAGLNAPPVCGDCEGTGLDLDRLVGQNRELNEALRSIAEKARWYAENPSRLDHEVDHALCVEVLSLAEDAITEPYVRCTCDPPREPEKPWYAHGPGCPERTDDVPF